MLSGIKVQREVTNFGYWIHRSNTITFGFFRLEMKFGTFIWLHLIISNYNLYYKGFLLKFQLELETGW